MTEDEMKAEIERLRKANRELHRRAQQVESPWIKERDRARAEAAMWRNSWKQEFDRVGNAFDYCKQIYELCAMKLGLPYGKYHSVNDCSFAKDYGRYVIIAAPILLCGSKVEKYELLAVVQKALLNAKTDIEDREGE